MKNLKLGSVLYSTKICATVFLLSGLVIAETNAQALGQADEQLQIVFDESKHSWQFDNISQSKIKDFDLDSTEIDLALNKIRQHQQKAKEGLGLTVNLNTAGRVEMTPYGNIGNRTIQMSTGSLLSVVNRNRELGGNLQLSADYEERIIGARMAAEIKQLAERIVDPYGQTVGPIEGGLDPDIIKPVIENICSQIVGPCTVVPPSGVPVKLEGSGLINSALISKSGNQELKTCDKAQKEFANIFEIQADKFSLGLKNWRNVAGAKDAAEKFDEACLDTIDSINDPNLLNRLAVIKMPEAIHPFCTAMRIGPNQFITAMHCFQSQGERIEHRIKGAQIFMYRAPSNAISIDQQLPPIIDNNISPKLTPAMRDMVIVTTDTFDDLDSNSFQDIVVDKVVGRATVIPGYFMYHSQDEIPSNFDASNNWTRGLRVDKRRGDAQCRIVDVSPRDGAGCLIHDCQVIPGFSGAPVLQEANGRLGLIGIHVYGDDGRGMLPKHCPSNFILGKHATGNSKVPLRTYANIAALINETNLENIGWKQN